MKVWLFALALATVLLSNAAAHEFQVGVLIIEHPFLRATPPAVQTGAGYMTIMNNGVEPDRLIAIETPVAADVEFHQTLIAEGIARMQPLPEGFIVPSGGSVVIGRDGTHAMLVGLTGLLVEGAKIEGTLVFERAGRIPIIFEVEAIGTPTEGHGDAHGQ